MATTQYMLLVLPTPGVTNDFTGEQQEVAGQAAANHLPRVLHGIARYGQYRWDAARARHLCGQRVCIGIPYLELLRRLIDLDDFVAGRDNRDRWFLEHAHGGPPERSEHCNIGIIQPFAPMQDGFMRRRFATARIDGLMQLGGAVDAHAIVLAMRVLHHHNGVRARRHGRAGHDFDRLSGSDFARVLLACPHLADHFQFPGKIDGPHRKSIARRARHARAVAVCGHIFGQHAAGGLGERNCLVIAWLTRIAHRAQNGFARFEERQRGHSILLSPVRLPAVA